MAVPVIGSASLTGTSLLVFGSNMTGATAVHLGAYPLSFAFDSDSRVNATIGLEVPSGTYAVSVTNPDGTGVSDYELTYQRDAHVAGGLRARLIRDSIYFTLYDSLEQLGWFDVGRKHLPIRFTGTSVDQDTQIELNTVALADEALVENELELGSNATENRWTFYVDFYAENDVIGKELINDVRDILAGRMSSIGRSHARIAVYDYRLATPERLFGVSIEDIRIDRATDFPKPWQKHWYACRFDVIDAYGDVDDPNYDPFADFGYEGGY